MQALSQHDERFVSKRLAGLLKYTYSIGKQGLGSSEHQLIETQLVQDLYIHLLKYLYKNGLLQQSLLSSHEITLYYSPVPELFILPNGSLFLSESLLEKTLQAGGIEALAFLLLQELSHIIKGYLRQNL